MIFLFLVFLIFPVAWLVSEFRARPALRVSLGLVAMMVVALVSSQVALARPESEKKHLHDSFGLIRQLLREQKLEKIEKAFSAYDKDASEEDLYRASQSLFNVLNGQTQP